MAKTKRLCRKSSRSKNMSSDLNYHSEKAFKAAKSRRKNEKAGRKTSRRK